MRFVVSVSQEGKGGEQYLTVPSSQVRHASDCDSTRVRLHVRVRLRPACFWLRQEDGRVGPPEGQSRQSGNSGRSLNSCQFPCSIRTRVWPEPGTGAGTSDLASTGTSFRLCRPPILSPSCRPPINCCLSQYCPACASLFASRQKGTQPLCHPCCITGSPSSSFPHERIICPTSTPTKHEMRHPSAHIFFPLQIRTSCLDRRATDWRAQVCPFGVIMHARVS